MKAGFYPKLAAEGIRKNKQLYLPYLLTGSVMVMMYYILSFLSASELLEYLKGGGILRTLLPLASGVIAVFSLIFIFYSNSFLLRKRSREFGLYNILGMDKRNLGRIMLWENLIVTTVSVAGGLILGISLSKLAELGMLNLLNEEINDSFQIDMGSARKTALLFAGIYLIILINSVVKVCRSSSLELLHSTNTGEKPPKAAWLPAVSGVLLLAIAYSIALSVEQPLEALYKFFIAVVLVILATYLCFISASVAFCRLLQKNKRYYYKPNHFISVSSMVYRMKRNGAGLASICILITMVLVMISSVFSLYTGAEDNIATMYPSDIMFQCLIPQKEDFNEETFLQIRRSITEKVPEQENVVEYGFGEVLGVLTENGFSANENVYQSGIDPFKNVGELQLLSLDDYNRIAGTDIRLEKDECLLFSQQAGLIGKTFTLEGSAPFKVKTVAEPPQRLFSQASTSLIPLLLFVTPDFDTTAALWPDSTDSGEETENGTPLQFYLTYNFDMNTDIQTKIEAYELLHKEIDDIVPKGENESYSYRLNSREIARTDFYALYGGLFFIGVLLSFIFLFSAVLIIYYKQISEGFEDQNRFEIMQKVGMTKKEIRKSINSQVLTVFFTPLLLAGIHLAFAFPVIWKLLQLFYLSNLRLMILVTVICFLIIGAFYTLVYKITSNAYFTIVSGRKA